MRNSYTMDWEAIDDSIDHIGAFHGTPLYDDPDFPVNPLDLILIDEKARLSTSPIIPKISK